MVELLSGSGLCDIFDVAAIEGDQVKKVAGMVEKLAVEKASSNLVATGRYLLDRANFDALPRIERGKGGELQITGAIDRSSLGPSASWSMTVSAMTSAIPPPSFPPASRSVSVTRCIAQLCSLTWKPCWRNIGVRWGRESLVLLFLRFKSSR